MPQRTGGAGGCRICPLSCGADRGDRPGACRAPGHIKIARASLHFYEEPAISGCQGSGTIFFSHCNLACTFCQNHEISQGSVGIEISAERLVEIAFRLKADGAHNINLVSPTPYTEFIREALLPAKARLGLPIVWNSNAYESVSSLERLEPLVDVYLPDLKFMDRHLAQRYCGRADYFQFASQAILEMWRQKKDYRFATGSSSRLDGMTEPSQPVGSAPGLVMTRGMIIRHLVMPGMTADSMKILRWIAEHIGTSVFISLMAQYTPDHRSHEFPEIDRRLRRSEYEAVANYFFELGFQNGWVQELSAAAAEYTPRFDLTGT